MNASLPFGPGNGGLTRPQLLDSLGDPHLRVVDWFALSESNVAVSQAVPAAVPVAAAGGSGWLRSIGRDLAAIARRVGRAAIEARMAQVERLLAVQSGWHGSIAAPAGASRPERHLR